MISICCCIRTGSVFKVANCDPKYNRDWVRMAQKKTEIIQTDVESHIFTVRGQKVIIDTDLAQLYGVETKQLNQAIKRNSNRFPDDFAFQLAPQEVRDMWSQTVTTLQRYRSPKYRPFAFTEHGAIMAATVLNSPKAVQMSVFVVRAFVKMREQLMATAALGKRLAEIEKMLLTHDTALRDLYENIRPLLLPPEQPTKKQIGFGVREARAKYTTSKAKGKKA